MKIIGFKYGGVDVYDKAKTSSFYSFALIDSGTSLNLVPSSKN